MRSWPGRVQAGERNVGGQRRMQRCQLATRFERPRAGRAVVIDHRAEDGQLTGRLHEFDQPGLTGPVDDAARGDFPEPASWITRPAPWPDGIEMVVAVQPE